MMNHMNNHFREVAGGLFSQVEKADVGTAYQDLGLKGVDLMGWADPFAPDDCLPGHVRKAALKAMASRDSAHYTHPVGLDLLKAEIAWKLKRQNALDADPGRNILITPGSDSGLFYGMMPFINEGDEVIIPTPCYPNNIQNTRLLGGIPRFVELKAEQGYQLQQEDLAGALSSKTKLVLLTHPNNPTTTVFNRRSLEILSDFIISHDLILVCDQAFEDFTFENEMITPASLPDMFARTVTVFSTSKGMGLSGFRVGYLVAPDIYMDKYYGAAVSVLGATNTVAQRAVLEAFKSPGYMEVFEKSFDKRRRMAFQLMNEIPDVSMLLPESGFLGWINISRLGSSAEILTYLIEEAKVCLNDGMNYGPGGEGHLRIVLGTYKADEQVFDALKRIQAALCRYKNK